MKSSLRLIGIALLVAFIQGCVSAKTTPTEPAEPAAPAVVAAPTPIGDEDGDGVLDDVDECPGTRAGVEVDARGCEVIYRFEGPLFDFDKATLTQEAQGKLIEAVAILKRNPAKAIEVAGHTDSVGSVQYNEKLGARRAAAVQSFLEANGVRAGRLQSKSYGETSPRATNDTAEGRQQNRRVEMVELPAS